MSWAGLVTVFAVCAPAKPSWQAGALIVLIAAIVYLLPVSATFVTAPAGTRRWLAIVYLFAVGISVLLGLVIPGGISNEGADYLGLFIGGVMLGAAFGGVAALWRRVGGVWRYLTVGAWGGGTFLAAAVGTLFFTLAITGACLD
jgi:hypothetical protein